MTWRSPTFISIFFLPILDIDGTQGFAWVACLPLLMFPEIEEEEYDQLLNHCETVSNMKLGSSSVTSGHDKESSLLKFINEHLSSLFGLRWRERNIIWTGIFLQGQSFNFSSFSLHPSRRVRVDFCRRYVPFNVAFSIPYFCSTVMGLLRILTFSYMSFFKVLST